MSVPLDRLYNHLDSLCNHDALIYRFTPHGSKKLTDLRALHEYVNLEWFSCITRPNMICHDQEPLNFEFYNKQQIMDIVSYMAPDATDHFDQWFDYINIRVLLTTRHSLYDFTMLVHSEKNSNELEKYEQAGFAGVYWWSHAAIAADWFRYAQHDHKLIVDINKITQDFLIYNRAWTGSREYRLKFAELIIDNKLADYCLMGFNAVDTGNTYTQHKFQNPAFGINREDLEQYFFKNVTDSAASADYNHTDYQHTAIEVVLETLFDDTRWHLTEKALRPIACGRPFILAATPGSLEYLRSYGFETFDGLIDESYDKLTDPVKRLECICKEMQRISQLTYQQKQQLWDNLYQISKRNQELFFSTAWQQGIFDEFVHNYNRARNVIDKQVSTTNWEALKEINFNLCPNAKMLQNLKVSLDNYAQIQAWIDNH